MTAAQAWRQMLAADQALARAKQRMNTAATSAGLDAAFDEVEAAMDASGHAHAAFSEALAVWERAA